MKKCVDARESGADHIDVWGSGSASREILYRDDAAERIVPAAKRCDHGDPVNLGIGGEITIRELVEPIAGLTKLTGEIDWDASKPVGQPPRAFDTFHAGECFGWVAGAWFQEGQPKIEWYERRRAAIEPTTAELG